MTESEALQALKLEGGFEICGRATRVAEFLKGLDIAEKPLKSRSRCSLYEIITMILKKLVFLPGMQNRIRMGASYTENEVLL